MVTVYGSAYKEGKQEFIDELHEVMNDWGGPTLIGGDFNLVRHISEKNNGNINFHWSYSFNDWINHWGLIEFKNPSRTYTWTNNQEQPIMAVLDRILASTNFEAHYPMANVKSTSRLGSDHVPLIINLGEAQEIKPHLFRFEKWWLEQKNLADIVRDSWNDHCPLSNPLDIWQFKLRALRRKLKGWSLNINADLRKKKQALSEEFDILDVFSEENNLTDQERERMECVKSQLEKIWHMDEIKARQRSREKDIKERDANTAYFQAIANHRKRKKTITTLQGPDGETSDTKEIISIATTFYKNLFGYEDKLNFHLRDSFWIENEMITSEENDLLTSPLSEEETRNAIFGSYADGAPGPDGFPFLFYQRFWDLIKPDFMALV